MKKEQLQTIMGYYLHETDNGCWIFTGGSRNNFHGSLSINNVQWQAHRLAYTIACEEIPPNMYVLHRCDVGLCVNPDHLFLGTQQDNIADMIAKGRDNRIRKGEENGRAVVNEAIVKQIREMFTQGVPREEIRHKFEITQNILNKIISYRTWRHI